MDEISIIQQLRNMNVGERLTFTFDKIFVVRNAASTLNKEFRLIEHAPNSARIYNVSRSNGIVTVSRIKHEN